MEKIRTLSLTFLVMLLCISFFAAVCFSQVRNGSFEADAQPSLANWSNSCNGESFQDAPNGGGIWSLKLPIGNFQGCFPGIGSQIIPEFSNGDIWQVRVWARQDEKKSVPTSVYLKIFHTAGDSTILSADTTTSKEWTQLTIVDTLVLDRDDSVAIVLEHPEKIRHCNWSTNSPTKVAHQFRNFHCELVKNKLRGKKTNKGA